MLPQQFARLCTQDIISTTLATVEIGPAEQVHLCSFSHDRSIDINRTGHSRSQQNTIVNGLSRMRLWKRGAACSTSSTICFCNWPLNQHSDQAPRLPAMGTYLFPAKILRLTITASRGVASLDTITLTAVPEDISELNAFAPHYTSHSHTSVSEEKSSPSTYQTSLPESEVGIVRPTEAERLTLRRISGSIPWVAYTICAVEFAERASYYGCQFVFANFVQFPLP